MHQQMNGIILAIENGSKLYDEYIKSYFTIFVEYEIHSLPNYFTFCPNHPEFVYKTPKTEILKCKCESYQMIYCCNCRNWHRIDESCK